jgi:CO dehydrogenase nickel-insertion accessory protein CooC1
MKLAFVGKGGSGKTTLAALLSRYLASQRLPVLAIDAIRGALEARFGVRLAFQNCHRVAVFRRDRSDDAYRGFVSARAQILNQQPELVDC